MVYNSIEEIPYERLRNGGTFEVRTENLPQGVYRKNGGVAVIKGNSPSLIIMGIALIIGTICTVVIIQQIGLLITRVKAIPEGKVIGETADGSKIWNSADGSSYLLRGDGTIEELGGGTTMDWNLVIYAVIFFAIIIIAWRLIPFIKKGKKIKLEDVSTYTPPKDKKR